MWKRHRVGAVDTLNGISAGEWLCTTARTSGRSR